MKKGIAIGQSDFKSLREGNHFYVDKSLMIKELLNDFSNVILLPRPRRFGKTLNMTMLKYFFTNQDTIENRKLFNGLKITAEPEFEKMQGKFPVIYLSFKDVKEDSYKAAIEKIRYLIKEEFIKFTLNTQAIEISAIDQAHINQIIENKGRISDFEFSIKQLCKLYYTYFKQKAIVLIDEYDTPIHTAYAYKYYAEMINFMRIFLGDGLKDNEYLEKGVLTGTLRISKESIFTGLNNLSVYSILSREFSTWFGFTPEELHQMLVDFELEDLENEITRWYNGYIFGEQEIYNPWSITKFVASRDKRFIPYWVNTSSNDFIKELIVESPSSVRTEFHELLKHKALIKTLDENISFTELNQTENAVFSFLVFSGYLKAKLLKFEDKSFWYELSIPNIEVYNLFNSIILNWFKQTFKQDKSSIMLKALLEKDIELFEELLGECILKTLSYHDVEKREVERVYQAFLLGVFVSLTPTYEVSSNRESGYGRYDICIVPPHKNEPAIILELKSIRKKETPETALASALKQIEDKQYAASIRDRGYTDILKLAVVFDGKQVWVQTA